MRPGLKADDKQAVQIITRYMCRFCGRQFDSMGDMQNHTQMHFSEKPPHSCYVCGRTYRTPSKLQRHVRVHSGERPYSCQICGKRFTRSDHVKQHMKVHLPQCQKNVCRLCGMRFMRRQTLQAHLRSHGYHQVFSCNRCGEAFESAVLLHQHKTTHEPDSEQTTTTTTSSTSTMLSGIKTEPECPDDSKPIVGLAKFGLGPQPDVKETIDGHYTSQSSRNTTSKLKKMLLTSKDSRGAFTNDIEAMARSSALQQENGDIDAILKSATALSGSESVKLAREAFQPTRECLAELRKREMGEEGELENAPSISISDCYSLATGEKGADAEAAADSANDEGVTGSTLTDGNRMIFVPPTDLDGKEYSSDHSAGSKSHSNENNNHHNGMERGGEDEEDDEEDEKMEAQETSPRSKDIDGVNSDDDIVVSIIPRNRSNASSSSSSANPKLTISCLPSVPRLMKPPRISSSSSSSSTTTSTFLPTLTKATPPLMTAPAFDLLNQRSVVSQISSSASQHLSSAYLPSSINALDAPITGRSSAYLFGKKMLRCDHCSIWFEDQSMSMLHMSLHSADESDPFTCKKCLKRLGNRLEFMAHIVWHLDPHMDDKLPCSYSYI